MFEYFYFSICVVLMLSRCVPAPSNSSKNGVVRTVIFYYDTTAQMFVYSPTSWPEGTIWYKDSSVIEKLTGIKAEQDKFGFFKLSEMIKGYV